jgi:hypothetical protein
MPPKQGQGPPVLLATSEPAELRVELAQVTCSWGIFEVSISHRMAIIELSAASVLLEALECAVAKRYPSVLAKKLPALQLG